MVVKTGAIRDIERGGHRESPAHRRATTTATSRTHAQAEKNVAPGAINPIAKLAVWIACIVVPWLAILELIRLLTR
jgi:hypothetical protein